ncbi:hypothetical protein WJX84_000483, partial [Apatococcus fuscideae]
MEAPILRRESMTLGTPRKRRHSSLQSKLDECLSSPGPDEMSPIRASKRMLSEAMAVDLSRLNMELSDCKGLHTGSYHDELLRQPCFDGSSEAGPSGSGDLHTAALRSPSGLHLHEATAGRSVATSNLADGPKFVPWRS